MKKIVTLCFGLLCCFAMTAAGQSDATLFVSSYLGGSIYKVDAATGDVTKIYTNLGSLFEDLVVGPDKLLYACDPTKERILRMDQNGGNVQVVYEAAGADPRRPQCGRFTYSGDLVINTGWPYHSGVWVIPAAQLAALPTPVSPVQITGAAGIGSQGVTTGWNGDLLITDFGGKVFTSPLPDYGGPTELISGLSFPAGIARNSTNRVYVSTSTGIERCDQDGNCESFATFTLQRAWHLEVAADDTLYAVTSRFLATVLHPNGRIWRITGPGACPGANCALVAELPKVGSFYPPAVGLAIGPTCVSRTKVLDASMPTQSFHFGSHLFEVSSPATTPVSVEIAACQSPPADVNALLDFNFPPGDARALPYSGENGWINVYTATQTPASGLPAPILLSIASFLPDAFGVNPRIIRNFSEVTSPIGYYPTIPLEGLEGDPVNTVRVNDFSDFVLADKRLAVADAQFCGLEPPVNASLVDTHPAGRTLPVKFRVAAPGGDCQKGPFLTSGSAWLSVARVEPDFERMTVTGPGNSMPGSPQFRVTGKHFQFNLSTAGWPPGLYTATVIGDNFLPQIFSFLLE